MVKDHLGAVKKHTRKHLPTFHLAWHQSVSIHPFRFIFIGCLIVVIFALALALKFKFLSFNTIATNTKASEYLKPAVEPSLPNANTQNLQGMQYIVHTVIERLDSQVPSLVKTRICTSKVADHDSNGFPRIAYGDSCSPWTEDLITKDFFNKNMPNFSLGDTSNGDLSIGYISYRNDKANNGTYTLIISISKAGVGGYYRFYTIDDNNIDIGTPPNLANFYSRIKPHPGMEWTYISESQGGYPQELIADGGIGGNGGYAYYSGGQQYFRQTIFSKNGKYAYTRKDCAINNDVADFSNCKWVDISDIMAQPLIDKYPVSLESHQALGDYGAAVFNLNGSQWLQESLISLNGSKKIGWYRTCSVDKSSCNEWGTNYGKSHVDFVNDDKKPVNYDAVGIYSIAFQQNYTLGPVPIPTPVFTYYPKYSIYREDAIDYIIFEPDIAGKHPIKSLETEIIISIGKAPLKTEIAWSETQQCMRGIERAPTKVPCAFVQLSGHTHAVRLPRDEMYNISSSWQADETRDEMKDGVVWRWFVKKT